ncbi:hypothetical protein NGRA_0402 [Nosema granulosis]|uniref:Uncharacterized protein n=1 Tax=Nosema granulosis TaxID=83296 RepID=A0A9P6L065_9MICR|nr:hypothetical protein NGRA_0402 [Nosema granulosis]
MIRLIRTAIFIYAFSVEIINTDNSRGTLNIIGTEKNQIYFIFLRNNVVPIVDSTQVQFSIYDSKGIYMIVHSLKQVFNLKYNKNLIKNFEYDYNLDIGTKIVIMKYKKGRICGYREIYDWCTIPDLSMVFVSYSLCGILLSLILKIYIN